MKVYDSRSVLIELLIGALCVCYGSNLFANSEVSPTSLIYKQQRIIKSAIDIMESQEISYVYGGYQLGSDRECESCNVCLEKKQPKAKERLSDCPQCQKCSIDCSHFVQLAYLRAGFKMPYLDTDTMLKSSKKRLLHSYNLIEIGNNPANALPGDLLVYRGHVVMLESLYDNLRADILHATGGREIRLPGQGIQRKRQALIHSFHGPLVKILRHKDLMQVKKLSPVK
ncbi:MAG: hypothetical protein R3B45_13870 [Bdellovibrionota bacterium]